MLVYLLDLLLKAGLAVGVILVSYLLILLLTEEMVILEEESNMSKFKSKIKTLFRAFKKKA